MNVLIFTSVLGIIAMVSEIFGFKKSIWYVVVIALLGISYVNFTEWDTAVRYYNDMVFIDNYAVAFTGLLLLLTLVWFFISKSQYESEEFNTSDQYAQILFSLTGAIILVSYSNLTMLFLGVEIMSIPLYILAGSRKHDLASNEASLKYFMMGAFATGFLLLGITFVYGATGSFNLDLIHHYTVSQAAKIPLLFYLGVTLIMVGLGFKVTAFPLHFWAPDVYEGAPVMITGFMATIVKAAAFGGFFRLFTTSFVDTSQHYTLLLSIIIGGTIITGNVLAVYQVNMKRLMAYSGIAQAGYLLTTLLLLSTDASNALLYYLAAYSLASLAAFAVIYWVIKFKCNDAIESFKGLGSSNPALALVLTVAMLSLAGIPPAAGFFGKFYLFKILLNQGYLYLVVLSIIGSLISVYYYFKVIIKMYGEGDNETALQIDNLAKYTLYVLIIALLAIGIMPDYLIGIIAQ